MKRKICFLVFLFCINAFAEDSLNNIKFAESKITFRIKKTSESYNLLGALLLQEGKLSSSGNGTTWLLLEPDYWLKNDLMEIYFSCVYVINFFDENRKFLHLSFPRRYKANVTTEELEKAIGNPKYRIDIYLNTSQTYPTTCQAIVIDNLNIRGEPSINSRKIGFLKKRSEITLYEESKNIDEIDGEKNPWYKVKLDDGTYGWVYGGYVRIFFEDPNLGYSNKEKILESIK